MGVHGPRKCPKCRCPTSRMWKLNAHQIFGRFFTTGAMCLSPFDETRAHQASHLMRHSVRTVGIHPTSHCGIMKLDVMSEIVSVPLLSVFNARPRDSWSKDTPLMASLKCSSPLPTLPSPCLVLSKQVKIFEGSGARKGSANFNGPDLRGGEGWYDGIAS